MKHLSAGLLALWSIPLLANPLQVTDTTGRTLSLPQPAQRIITLSPHATELVYAAGAGDRLVAVAAFSDHPPEAAGLPQIGGIQGMDREQLLLLQPDLVVAWDSGNRSADLSWLETIGMVVYRSEPRQLADIADTLEKLGVLAGTTATAAAAATDFREKLQTACNGTSLLKRKAAYYEIWPQPAMTIGGRHWLNEVMQRAGLVNVFADQDRAILTVEPEAALSRPATIRISRSPDSEQDTASQTMTLAGSDLLTRPGTRVIGGIRRLCKQLNGSFPPGL